jgi:D-alanyl-D-alanine carboxypeptidase
MLVRAARAGMLCGYLTVLLVCLAACDGGSGRRDACPMAAELQSVLDQAWKASGAAAATAAMRRSDGCSWEGASGRVDVPGDVAATAHHRFRIGSVTKTFTATVVLQLIDEGAFRLDDMLERWVPGVANGGAITIEQLLRHTSGVYDYLDQDFFARAAEEWTPEALVAYANERPPAFAPGTRWGYSNTNYILLGMIIELATGGTYQQQVRDRVIAPLGLADTFVEGAEEIPGGFARGYLQQDDGYVDVRDALNPSAAWAAGAVVSSAADVARFGHELLRGHLLSPRQVAEMTRRTMLPDGSAANFGIGLIMEASPHGLLQGNNGRSIGFRSDFVHVPGDDATLAVLVNDGETNPRQIRDALLEATLF